MIKAAVLNRKHVHLLVLIDGNIEYHECPREWFPCKMKDGGGIEIQVESWPPPLKPQKFDTIGSEEFSTNDSITVKKG